MLRLMGKKEKAALVETFEIVAKAPEGKWVGSGDNLRWSTKAQFTKDSWRRYYVGHYDYAVTDDGYVIRLAVPKVQNEFWYDDEYADPLPSGGDARRDFFVRENMRREFGIGDWRTEEWFELHHNDDGTWHFPEGMRPYIAKSSDYAYSLRISVWRDERGQWERERSIVRELTDEELNDYVAIQRRRMDAFAKRLDTYYRRYGDRVRSHGYWANR